FFCLTATPTPPPHTLSLHDALPISQRARIRKLSDFELRRQFDLAFDEPTSGDKPEWRRDRLLTEIVRRGGAAWRDCVSAKLAARSEEHTSELQSPDHLVCRLLLEKK